MTHERDPFQNRWMDRLDRLIPASLHEAGGDLLTRSRLTVGTGITGGLLVLFTSVPIDLWLGRPAVAALNTTSALLLLATPLFFRTTRSARLTASYVVGLGWLSLIGIYLGGQGTNPSVLYAFSIIPLVAMLLGGPRVGVLWTVMSCGATYLLTRTWAAGITLPVSMVVENLDQVVLRDVLTITVWVGLFAAFYDTVRGRAVDRAWTAMRRAEESEERFARAFASNPDAIAISELESDVVVECNEGFLRAFELTRDELIGRLRWGDVLSIDRTQRDLLLDGSPRPDGRRELEIQARRDDAPLGDTKEFVVTAARIEVDGRPCLLSTARDVTERKSLDRQLRQAQKMEAVGQLAGSIAHDFNNMLTVISGYSSQLKGELQGELGEIAEEIHDAAQRSATLTRQLLSFSRQHTVEHRVLDLGTVLDSVDSLLHRLIGEDVAIRLAHEAEGPFVRADCGQLEQVIVNLAINARDAMPDGGTLTIRTGTSTQGPPGRGTGDWALIRVEDTGEGMDDETLARAVDPFFTTKREGKGTGLGLSTVHGIVLQNDGDITLVSRPGEGTVVTVYLPRAEPEDVTCPTRSVSEPRARRESARILLVEDESMVRRLATRALELAGHRVIQARDGSEALDIARDREGEIDLVLTDVVMPRMSGSVLAQRLAEEQPELPVMFMSGYPNPSDTTSAHLPRDAEFIRKPFTPSELTRQVERALDRAKPAQR